jgi:hypothetical protein
MLGGTRGRRTSALLFFSLLGFVVPALGHPGGGALTIAAPLVFDPKLDDGNGGRALATVVASSAGAQGSLSSTITIQDANGNQVRALDASTHDAGDTWTVTWDGTNDQGQVVPTGAYAIVLGASGSIAATAQAPINVVRLGARAIQFLDTDTSLGPVARIPLAYDATNGTARSYFAIDSGGPQWTLPASTVAAGSLDDATGAPLAAPQPWTTTGSPPTDSNGVVLAQGRSFPEAYVAGSTMHVQVTLGDTSVSAATGASQSCGYPIAGVPIQVSAGGQTAATASPGAQATLDVGATVPPGLGKTQATVALTFQYQDSAGWHAVPGQQTTLHTVYSLMGVAQTADTDGATTTDAREEPFVAAIDLVAGWAQATPVATPADALALIVENVYASMGLTYDVVAGAPAYADGDAGSPSYAFTEMVNGEQRGKTVNCADCAGTVGLLGRSVGVDVQTAILGWDFPLNYILGIGATKWAEAIFTSGGASFSFHAVATVTGGQTIHDACLCVDDGPKPGSVEARVKVLPINMDFNHYMSKLTSGSFTVQSLGRPTQN